MTSKYQAALLSQQFKYDVDKLEQKLKGTLYSHEDIESAIAELVPDWLSLDFDEVREPAVSQLFIAFTDVREAAEKAVRK